METFSNLEGVGQRNPFSIRKLDLKDTVAMAVDECIAAGILGEFFERYREMIITADPIVETMELHEKFAREEGREEGVFSIIASALKTGKTPEMVAEFNGIPLETVLEVQHSIHKKV